MGPNPMVTVRVISLLRFIRFRLIDAVLQVVCWMRSLQLPQRGRVERYMHSHCLQATQACTENKKIALEKEDSDKGLTRADLISPARG